MKFEKQKDKEGTQNMTLLMFFFEINMKSNYLILNIDKEALYKFQIYD